MARSSTAWSGWRAPGSERTSSGQLSGSGTAGGLAWCSAADRSVLNDASRHRIGVPSWVAVTRRRMNVRPSWSRSTRKITGLPVSPGRRK